MQKKIIAVAVGGIFASSVVGANFYADHRLNDYYNQKQAVEHPLIQKQDSQVKMGLWSGDANWSYKIVPDPCKPQDFVVIKGVDHIKRSWNGYHIQSDVNFDLKGKDAATYQWLLKNQSFMKLDSQLNWFGTVNVKVTSPSVDQQKDDFQIVWNGINGTLKLKKEDGKYRVTQADLKMPGFTMRNGNNYMSLQSMQFKADQGFLGQELNSGKTEFSIQKMILLDQTSRLKKNVELDKLQLTTEADVQEKETSVKANWSIDQMQIDDKKLKNIKLNFNLIGLDTHALQEFIQLANSNNKACSFEARQVQQQQLNQQMLKIAAHGFSYESKGNQIELGQSKLTADLQGKLVANQYADMQEFRTKAPMSAQFQANASMDKQFLRNMMNLSGKMPSGVSDQDYDRALPQIVQMGHGKMNGDKIDFAVKYENGQFSYP
ncbi:hypothetical protein F975_01941 [Acinetobacter sp. ANC 3789]|uniref:DUF945 family protein n=1 Tax=Acinetobacter sp. ANC 3789 TaxID=1217714 RepID=UPI0002CF079D|nr:DUF945 family protein [Acinetobacter sp. ANC 3789]ENU80186.1 hypothetical protein F975_01941 [Acinetobacter sp. ANC 3789]